MRKLVVTENVTLDGSVDLLDDWLELTGPDDQLAAFAVQQAERSDTTLLGRATYETFLDCRCTEVSAPLVGCAAMSRSRTYVISSSLTDTTWPGASILSGNWRSQLSELKWQSGADIVARGSVSVVHALLDSGLVDEVRLYVHPVIQGRGRRLFPEGRFFPGLRLIDVHDFPTGVTYLAYSL